MSNEMPPPRAMLDWVTYSGITLHRTCPQKWHYRYLRGLDQAPNAARPPVERDLGSWWHALRAATGITRGKSLDSLRSCPDKIGTVDGGPEITVEEGMTDLREAVLDKAHRWWNVQATEYQEMFLEKLKEPLVDRLENMDGRWQERWQSSIDSEAPLGVEMKWDRPLPGSGVTIMGYADEVYMDTRRNLVVVRDYKTGKKLDTQSAADDMMDSQLHLYAWGLTPTVREWGHRIKAVAYDRIRSVKPTTPKLTQTGTLSKSVSDYDLPTYLEWLKGDGPEWGEPGVYYASGAKKDQQKWGRYEEEPALVAKLQSPATQSVWFQRTLTPINRNVVKAHLQAAVDGAKDMAVTTRHVQRRGEAARRLTSMCRYCDYVELCRAQMMGGPNGEYPLDEFNLVSSRTPDK